MTIWIVSAVALLYASMIIWLGLELWRAPLVDESDHILDKRGEHAADGRA